MQLPTAGGATPPGAPNPATPANPAPPGGTGQAVVPQGMAGKRQAAMVQIKVGLMAFQSALQGLEMGSDLHAEVMKAIAGVSKRVSKADEPSAGSQVQELANMAKTAQTNPQKAALMRAMPESPGPAGGGAPPMAEAA